MQRHWFLCTLSLKISTHLRNGRTTSFTWKKDIQRGSTIIFLTLWVRYLIQLLSNFKAYCLFVDFTISKTFVGGLCVVITTTIGELSSGSCLPKTGASVLRALRLWLIWRVLERLFCCLYRLGLFLFPCSSLSSSSTLFLLYSGAVLYI